MIRIESIEIYYFRSIYYLKLSNLQDLIVFSGRNDCGKSNILKALNLFFNNQTDWHNELDFYRDYSKIRLEEVRKETVKGRQFIRVKLHFVGGSNIKSLPDRFFVSKTWYRNSNQPDIKSDIERQFRKGIIKTKSLPRALAGLQHYLNRLSYEYIPAVKDRSFFRYFLGILQDAILDEKSGDKRIAQAVNSLNKAVEESATTLSKEFLGACNIEAKIRLPQELAALFRAFSIETGIADMEMPLTMRGDGIQARFLPSLLHFIASNSKQTYLWGFEEPENCLEHALATELAKELSTNYNKISQIFTTSHSPAIFSLSSKKSSVYRVFLKDSKTEALSLVDNKKIRQDEYDALLGEIGLYQLAKEQQKKYEEKKQQIETELEGINKLKDRINKYNMPILLTEGKTDTKILREAWRRLYPDTKRHFKIIPCDPSTAKGGAGGCGTLMNAIATCRLDEPTTIALFDRDDEGIKTFSKAPGVFTKISDDIIIHKNNNAGGFLIPAVGGKEKYVQYQTLCIEFVFPDEFLERKQNGKGLTFKQLLKEEKVKGITINKLVSSEPHLRQIVSGKNKFAKIIVPQLPDEAFANFQAIFDVMDEILIKLEAYGIIEK